MIFRHLDMLSCLVSTSLLVVGEVQLCTIIRRVTTSVVYGVELNFESLERYHDSCVGLGLHQFSSTSSPLVPYFMRAPRVKSGLGPARAKVGLALDL